MIDLMDVRHTPFVDGGRDPRKGLDCWGLVRVVLRRMGIDAPDYRHSAFASHDIGGTAAREMAGGAWAVVTSPKAGDVVCMDNDPAVPGTVQHFGVYLGGNLFIHILQKTGVLLTDINDPFWARRIRGYCRWTR